MSKAEGRVYIVGAGCGDADLITVRGQNLIENSDVIVYDDLISPNLLTLAKDGAEIIYMGKRSGRHSASQEEINRVKDELREYTDRVNKGETTFSTLARLYSEDPGSARMGGEMDYVGRGMLDPAFANVAFNLTDPKKISKIVESEFGYHIIQLIDKRGDKIKVRHILRKPVVPQESIDKAILRLDSIGDDIRSGKFTFESAVSVLSDDKDTKNNRGLMANTSQAGVRTSKFQMKELPTEIARMVDTMKVGEVSRSFQMINSRGKTTCALVKLVSRVEGHRATITEDFQVMQNVVQAKEREKTLHDWVVSKIKSTYVRMNDRYKDCKFEYQGWVK